ncbi:MAG: amidohydrolase family protein [Acidobacteria bacterium]|nr:amidohydrolase family protein [Acidobacteriota bacterium]
MKICIYVAMVIVNAGLFSAQLSAQGKTPPASGWAETIVVNGNIATMNDTQRFVEALAIREGKIVAVGSRQEVESYAGPQTRLIDLRGRTAIPGVISAHDHPELWITWFHSTGSKLDPQWDQIPAIGKSPEEAAASILRTVERAVQQRKTGQWIMLRTDEDGERAIRNKLITPEQLDRVAPNNPVLVRPEFIDVAVSKNGKILDDVESIRRAFEGYGPPLRSAARGQGLRNSKAREALRANKYDENMRAHTTATVIMQELIPRSVGLDAYAEAIRRELQFWAETQGVTAVATTFFRSPSIVTAGHRLAKDKKMPIRLAWYTNVEANDFGSLEGVGDPYLWNIGVQHEAVVLEEMRVGESDPSLEGTEFADATTYASALPLKDPRLEKVRADFISQALLGLPGTPGREMIMRWLRQGVRVGDVHCYSDGAVDMFIGILEELQKETGWNDEKIRSMRNFYLTHLALVRPDQYEKIKRWGMVVGPSWRTMFDLPRLKKTYGEEFKKYVWPVKSMLAAGVKIAPNLDMSPTIGPEGEGMWDILEFLVDREYAGEEWNKGEAVDRWTALKLMTLDQTFILMREDELGSLDVGKWADLVVLDKDYFSIPVKEISTLTPLLTMVGGQIVYQRDGTL